MQPPLSDPHFNSSPSVENQPPVKSKRWGWGLIVLWSYGLLCVGILVLGFFATYLIGGVGEKESLIIGSLLFPVLLFLVLAGVKNFKK